MFIVFCNKNEYISSRGPWHNINLVNFTMHSVTSPQEFNDILSKNKYVFVDFYADWCGPCKMMTPVVEALERENTHVVFVKINVDSAQELTRTYGVSAMPTFMSFVNGKKTEQIMGANGPEVKRVISLMK